MNFIDFSLKLNNFPISKAQEKLKAIQELNNKEYALNIEKQKKEIVNYHLENNSFYNNLVKNKDWTWNSLPVLTKKDLQVPLKNRLSKEYSLKNIFKNKTSGSTGNPFYFAKDKFSHALTWSVIKNRFNWHDLYNKKQARFYGIPNDFFGKSKEQIKDFFLNRYRFNVFDLSDSALENWISIFKSKKFIYLNGYTTVLVAFSKYLIAKDITLKQLCPTLKACVVTSEMLFDNDKKNLEKGFGVKIINEYGASELDLIAFQDNNNNWIINTETLFVEVLDDNNKVLNDGEVGNLIITSLYNKAHPFIRYKIGDKGALKKINSKKTILVKLEGRSEDLVKLPSGRVAPGLTFYYITKSIMEDSDNIKEIKIVQTKLNAFKIYYVANTILQNTKKEIISKALIEYLEPNLELEFIYSEKLERTKSGKLKQFTSLLKEL